jgi:hypothetical protein
MWMLLVARVLAAAPDELPWGVVRVSGGGGLSTEGPALRIGVEGEVWNRPHRAYGLRFGLGGEGNTDALYSARLEPTVTWATDGRLRVVTQIGAGIAVQDNLDICPFGGCEDEAPDLVLTTSVAGGIASRRSTTTLLLRLEADSGLRVAAIPTIAIGGTFPVRSRAEDAPGEHDRP